MTEMRTGAALKKKMYGHDGHPDQAHPTSVATTKRCDVSGHTQAIWISGRGNMIKACTRFLRRRSRPDSGFARKRPTCWARLRMMASRQVTYSETVTLWM